MFPAYYYKCMSFLPKDIYEEGIAAMILMLYFCVSNQAMYHAINQNSYLQILGPLIQLPSIEIKLLSKALIARMIPADAVKDDMAVLILIEDDEVDHLLSILSSDVQSYNTVPCISVMADLSRSPHNMWAFASRDVALKLSDLMDHFGEDDQSKAAQLIWRVMELNYEGSEEVSLVINSGTQLLSEEGNDNS